MLRRLARGAIPALAALSLAGAAGADSGTAPRRVVSVNLCLDELAWRIAAPRQLVAVSRLAHDASLSSIADASRALPGIELRAEAILALRPDLVLLESHGGAALRGLLRDHGIAVAEFAIASDLAAAAAQMLRLGTLLGREPQARELARAMLDEADRLAAARPGGAPATWPVAALWQANRGTQGSGTLPHDLLQRAGWRNYAAERGITGFATLSMEELLLGRPQLLVIDAAARASGSLAEALQFHPALRREGSISRHLAVARRALVCAGPQSLEALRALAAARRGVASAGTHD